MYFVISLILNIGLVFMHVGMNYVVFTMLNLNLTDIHMCENELKKIHFDYDSSL